MGSLIKFVIALSSLIALGAPEMAPLLITSVLFFAGVYLHVACSLFAGLTRVTAPKGTGSAVISHIETILAFGGGILTLKILGYPEIFYFCLPLIIINIFVLGLSTLVYLNIIEIKELDK